MKKTLSIMLTILMVVTMLPIAIMPASAATEATDLPTGDVSYYEGVTQYFKYNNYLYKVTWGNYIFHKTNGTKSVELVRAGNYLACYPNGLALNDYLNKEIGGLRATRCTISDLPKTINTSLNCFNEMSSRHIDKTKPIAVITCVGVNAPTWTWSDDKTSANAVFVSADGKAQVTIGVTVTSSTVAAENCQEKDKITYTASTTFNGTAYSDIKTEDGAAGPHIYNKEVATESYFKSAATCDNPTVYYKSCVCGACDKSATFNYGSALGHDEEPTYQDNGDGTHTGTYYCCGATVTEDHSTTAEDDKEATCVAKAYCSVCESYYGEVDKTNHDSSVEYENGFCPNCDAYEPAELVDGVYQISNAGNLYWFADKVTNENAAYGSADAILTCDIRVNEGTMTEASTGARVWTPIGKVGWIDNKRVEYPYTGTFEGNGKTVSGLYFNDTSANFSVGLFSVVGEGGKVQNVGIADSYFCGGNNVGAVVGNNYGTVTDCYNTGTVSGERWVGGVVCANDGTVTNCYNTGIVSGTSSVGGVVGINHGTVTGCYNTGTVSGSSKVGGVVGDNEDTVTGCYNTGTGTVSGSSYVGGVVGTNWTAVTNCYNTGSVSGTTSVGGVVGYNISDTVTVTNCYFDSTVYTGDAIGNNYGTATDVEGKSTEQFASGEVAYLLSQGENGSIWGQDLDNGKPVQTTPTFNGAKVYCGYTSCGDTVAKYTNDETISAEKPDHTQKPTYTDNGNGTHSAVYPCCGTTVTEEHDFENDAHQCDCGYACPHSSYTDGVCDKCGYECAHEWGEGVLTRPVYDAVLGSKDGYYTYTCTLCGEEKTETVKSADYSAYEAVSEEINALLQSDELTDAAKQAIYSAANECGLLSNDLTESEQNIVDDLVAELEKIVADAEEKIASGEYVKANYNGIYQAIHRIEDKFFYEGVTDEGKAGLEEIKKRFEAMKADENTSAADVAEFEKEIEAYEEELDKGIEDGTLVMIRPGKIVAEFYDKWKEWLEAEGLTDEYKDFIDNQKATGEALAAEKEIIDFMASLEGTVAENAENIAKLNEMNNSFTASFENCLRGTHNFNDYEVTSPAKCGKNAIETRTCWFCGETDEREVEGSALEHSFTKYEETEAPKCGVAGKEVATCDNGCGATDEKEIPALEHVFIDYASNGDATCTSDGTKTASCIYGCGATDTVADEGSKLTHVDEDGDKLCDDCGGEVVDICPDCGLRAHENTGVPEYICLLITFIRLIVPLIKIVIAAM